MICADDVHGTEAKQGFSPGREKAANSAELIGAGVTWPDAAALPGRNERRAIARGEHTASHSQGP